MTLSRDGEVRKDSESLGPKALRRPFAHLDLTWLFRLLSTVGNRREGNKSFRELIKGKRQRYQATKHQKRRGFAQRVLKKWQSETVPGRRVVEREGRSWKEASSEKATDIVMKMLGRRSRRARQDVQHQQYMPKDPISAGPPDQGSWSLSSLAAPELSPVIGPLYGHPEVRTSASPNELPPTDGPNRSTLPSNTPHLSREAPLNAQRQLVFERSPERGRNIDVAHPNVSQSPSCKTPLDRSKREAANKAERTPRCVPPRSREIEESTGNKAELTPPNTAAPSRNSPIDLLLENWTEWSHVLGLPEAIPSPEVFAERSKAPARCRRTEVLNHRNSARDVFHIRRVCVAAVAAAALLLFLADGTRRYWVHWDAASAKENAVTSNFKLENDIAALLSLGGDVPRSDKRVAFVLLSGVDDLRHELSRQVRADETFQVATPSFVTDQCPLTDAGGRAHQENEASLEGSGRCTEEKGDAWSKARYGSTDQEPKSSFQRTLYEFFPPWACTSLFLIAVQFALVQLLYVQGKREMRLLRQWVLQSLNTMMLSRPAMEQCIRSRLTREKWKSMPDTGSKLVTVTPNEKEYWDVVRRLQRDMPDAHISSLWRVNNVALREFYSFHQQHFERNGIDASNELLLWHGTGNVDPAMIYRDCQHGFMMQFADAGLWGRGLYFAEHSDYSDLYSYAPHQAAYTDRPGGDDDEREMFLATLLVGNEVTMEGKKSLVVPPLDPANPGRRYTTVKGYSGGYPIYTVYENGRAFPTYLVRYYKGERNTQRTPFSTFDEAKAKMAENKVAVRSQL